jgi:hypothetical protein
MYMGRVGPYYPRTWATEEKLPVMSNIKQLSVSVKTKFLTAAKCTHEYKGKGKAIPLHAWICPEGSRRMRLPDFMTVGT